MKPESVTHRVQMFSHDNLERETRLLDTKKPKYVFVENIFLSPQIPLAYQRDSEDLVALLGYVRQFYGPYQHGEYLTALKRKE